MDAKKVTCWFNWQEWKSMIDDAYNQEQDLSLMNKAFSTILAWEARDSTMPPALICLKEILLAKLCQIDKNNSSIHQMYQYQSTLAMSIIRFVNFITEPYQTNVFAKPIKVIANNIGLPDWIVNLRHNATHFSLPSIEILENAREYLYNWLKVRYVDTYKEIALEQSILKNVKLSIENLFVDYLNARYNTTLIKSKKSKSNKDEMITLDKKIEVVTIHFRNETFDTLLEDGFLIPTKEQLNAIGIIAEEYLESEQINLPKPLLNIWSPYLQYCSNTNNLIRLLFQKLVNTYKIENDQYVQFNKENIRNKFLLAWILTLIKFNSFKNDKKLKFQFHFELNFQETLLDIIKGKPSKFCLPFLTEASKIPSFMNEIGKEKFDKLLKLMSLVDIQMNEMNQIGLKEDSSPVESNDNFAYFDMSIFERNSVKKSTQFSQFNPNIMVSLNKQNVNSSIKSDWILMDEIDWNMDNIKLGLYEGQTYENYDLNVLLNPEISKEMNGSFLISSDLNQSLTEQSNENKSQNLLFNASKLVNKDYVNSLKHSFFNTYWELS